MHSLALFPLKLDTGSYSLFFNSVGLIAEFFEHDVESVQHFWKYAANLQENTHVEVRFQYFTTLNKYFPDGKFIMIKFYYLIIKFY